MTVEYENILKKTAAKLRMEIIKSIYLAGSGHPGGSLSCIDILLYLYKDVLNIKKNELKSFSRDRFILSKGHAAPALYAVLAEFGFFPHSELKNLRKIGSILQGHPNMHTTPGVDFSTGSLGQGTSVACGMALGIKLNKELFNVYCLLGDGELQEGQVFEAFCFASHQKLSNLCFIVDNNNLQIDGSIKEVAGFVNIDEKLKSFGLNVIKIDGHDFCEIEKAFQKFHQEENKPTAILAKTVKGKGVGFMENKLEWHGKAPKEEEFLTAMKELEERM